METKDFWVYFFKAPADEAPIKIQVFDSDSPDGMHVGDDFLGECYVPLPVKEEVVQAQRVLLKRADKPKEQVSGSLSTLVAFRGIATHPTHNLPTRILRDAEVGPASAVSGTLTIHCPRRVSPVLQELWDSEL
eukprot:Filipodium_phascolosomae@DN2817_c17_g1_i6.p1